MSSIVASVGYNYVPPFAQTTAHHGGASASSAASAAASGGATDTSISFAKIATGTATASSAAAKPTHTSIISTDGGIDSTSLLEYFTKPYIDAHSLSVPTWRYAYVLWFAIAGVLILWSLVYQLIGASRGSALSALFRKYSIKRFVIQNKKSKKAPKGTEEKARPVPVVSRSQVRLASPTYAQIIVLLALLALSCCLSFLGVSYINPRTCTFGGTCPYQSVYSLLPPKMLRRASTSNPGGWVAYTDPLLSASNTDIDKNWWTSAARLGLIAFALLPLCVTLALKQWPFNIWATPFLTDYHYDKTAILHRWSGRIIWLFASGHVAAWFYQSVVDKDPFGRPVLISLLGYWRFLAGIVAHGLLTLLTLVSFRPIRDRHYELFYWSHIVMVFTLFATCIIHHRPLMWWPIIAAIIWGAERLCRLLVQLHVNGVTKGIGLRPKPSKTSTSSFLVIGAEKIDGYTDGKGRLFGPGAVDEASVPLANSGAPHAATTNYHVYPPATQWQHSLSLYLPCPALSHSTLNYNTPNAHARQLPSPGFASAQILPGRTIRLTIHTPRAVRWQPGQHVLLTLPTLRLFQAHPYTIACCDERAKGIAPIGGASTIEGSEIIMLIRAQRGFSRTLWDHVVKERKEMEASGVPAAECVKGIELRALIGWPLGSSCRTTWGQYESLLIICGGTGVTFGISVLEYTCRRLARRDADDRKYKTSRVRFVWILREFAHLTWVAPTLRRCLDMVDPSRLQVEVFVSRDPPSLEYRHRQPSTTYLPGEDDEFAAPSPPFARSHRAASPGRGDSGDESEVEEEGSMRTRYFQRAYPIAMYGEAVESVTDLVLFDGEDDYRTPGEADMSSKVRKVGKIRRALSRRNRSKPTEPTTPYIGATAPSPYRSEARDPFTAPEYDRSYSEVALGADRRHVDRSDSPTIKRAYEDTPYQSFEVEEENSCRLGPNQIKSTSYHRLVDSRSSSYQPTTAADENGLLDVSAEDQADLDIVAEFAKPGYPKLAEILDAEVNSSQGKTMVACCGPNGLNTLVRHLVSSRIEIKKLLKGDPRAQISLVCEDFSF